MEESLKKLLIDGICKIDSSLCTEDKVNRLECLYDQITLFNPSYKLVAAEGKELLTRHILDCLAPAMIIKSYLKDGSSVADLGSGSGLPGFVLASVLDNLNFSLVDKMGRRIGFLRNTVAFSGMSSKVKIVESELERLNDVYDAVVFRAFRPLGDIICDLDRITKSSSYIFAYKSSEENIQAEKKIAEEYGKFEATEVPYSVPFLDARRSLLVLKKI